MVTLEAADLIPIRDFELAWRITDPRWAVLPESVLQSIKPLARVKAQETWSNLPLGGVAIGPATDLMTVTSEQSLADSSSPGDAGCRDWFRDLPIELDEQVYLCWNIGSGVALVTRWGTFLETWEDLWYPFDELGVFDDTRQWVLLFGPGEAVRFAEQVVKQVVV